MVQLIIQIIIIIHEIVENISKYGLNCDGVSSDIKTYTICNDHRWILDLLVQYRWILD